LQGCQVANCPPAPCDDLAPARKFVVYPGQERYRIAPDIEAISLAELATELSAA